MDQTNALVNDMVVEGLDDWVYSVVLVRAVEDATGLAGESLLRVTLEVIGELLRSGLMLVGDAGTATRPFTPWPLTIPEALTRFEREWRVLGLDSDFVDICWFSNTSTGSERAHQLQAHLT